MMTLDIEHAIAPEEFRARQEKARASAEQRGLDGLMVWSRGGGPVDMSADVVYLANHYSQQPYMADHVGIGSGRSHGVLVLPVKGRASWSSTCRGGARTWWWPMTCGPATT